MPRLTLGYRVALLIGTLLISSAIVTMLASLQSVESTMSKESTQSVANIHASVNALISLEYDNIQRFRVTARDRRMAELRDLTNAVEAGVDEIRSQAQSGELTLTQAQESAKAFVKSVRYGNNDYLYAFDREMTSISHPDPEIEGRNLLDLTDASGKLFIRDIQEVALGSGSGFVDYTWRRLGEEDPSAKLVYVSSYEPWQWIFGAGIYVDDIEREVAQRLEEVKAQLAATLSTVRFSEQGFFFILDDAGDVVVSPTRANLSGLTTTPGGEAFVQQVLARVPAADDAIVSMTADVALTSQTPEQWSVNLSTFNDLGWVLVSAVPTAELEAPARSLMVQQGLLTLGVLLLGLAGGLLMSRRLTRPVEDVTSAARDLARDQFDPTSLDKAAARTDEIGELARAFQRMGVDVVAREAALRAQVARLTVEIDHARREEQVREITETDFFADLAGKADAMRRRIHDDPDDRGA